MNPGAVIVAGMAPGLGVALAQLFGAEGYRVVGLSRSDSLDAGASVPGYRHIACDVTDSAALRAAVGAAAAEGPVVGLIWNPMHLVTRPFADLTEADFEAAWRVGCLGAFAAAQALLPHLGQGGTMIFTGATASLRAGARFAAFAAAKFALRALAQSLAREYGPKGIHVVHTVLDGLIDAPQTFARFPNTRPEACLSPDALARTYLDLFRQPPGAWTQEIDLRPASEPF